jgi:hypothetical protein
LLLHQAIILRIITCDIDTAVTYTLYLKMKNKLRIKFLSTAGLPNNKVIWLLLNKASIDNSVKERMVIQYGVV